MRDVDIGDTEFGGCGVDEVVDLVEFGVDARFDRVGDVGSVEEAGDGGVAEPDAVDGGVEVDGGVGAEIGGVDL